MSPHLLIPLLLVAAAAQPPPAGPIRFEEVTEKAGIRFTHSFGAEKLGSLLESTGAGCVWFDYNNDGYPDLYVVSGKALEKGMHPYPLRKPPTEPPHNHLYRNNGNGTFEDVTAKAGLKVAGWSIGSAWLDYDRDGCLDLFVGRYVKFDPAYRAYYAADNYPGPLDYAAETSLLFHNNCNGTFTDVSEKAGLTEFKSRAMGVTAADFDLDGYPDIYVANDKTENFLFHNQHNGTFKEIAVPAGVAYGQSDENTSAMGPVFSDFDHDGKVDLWVSDSKYNRMMRNLGGLKFQDVTERAGISQLAAQYTSWGTGAHDFDNDGRDDVFIVHGGLIHMLPQEHSVFRNLGDWKFEDVSSTAGPFFDLKTGVKSVGRGAAFADYDNDGKIDVFIVNLGGPAYLLHNTSPGANHWISIKLVGKKSNRDGIGAQVEIVAGTQRQQHERVAGSGYLSQDDGRVNFGLGAASKIDKLTVTWPSGTKQTIENITAGRVMTVQEE